VRERERAENDKEEHDYCYVMSSILLPYNVSDVSHLPEIPGMTYYYNTTRAHSAEHRFPECNSINSSHWK